MSDRDAVSRRKRPRLLTLGTGAKRSFTVPVAAILIEQSAPSSMAAREGLTLLQLAFKAAQGRLISLRADERIPVLPPIITRQLMEAVGPRITATALGHLCAAGHEGWRRAADPVWCRLCAELIRANSATPPARRAEESYLQYHGRLMAWQEESLRELGGRLRESYETERGPIRPLKVIGPRRNVSMLGSPARGRSSMRDPFAAVKSSSSLMKRAKSETLSATISRTRHPSVPAPTSSTVPQPAKMYPPLFKK